MARRAKKTVQVRAKFEPDNIEDKNAIKFEVLLDDTWYIIGYCGVKKIPKLHKALTNNEVKTVSLLFVKRQWIPWRSSFEFNASVSVVKTGPWEEDDPNNQYNSNFGVTALNLWN